MRHQRDMLMALCAWGALSLACVWAWTPTFTNISNSLEHNGRWRVGKMEPGGSAMGTKSFFNGTQALASQQLNLGAWHSFQRVIIKETRRARSIELGYSFPQKDYLLILLNYSDTGFDALKIPSDTTENAMLAHVKYTGEFLSTKPFALLGRKSDAWNTAKLSLEPERIGISINGSPDTWQDLHIEQEQNIGFQSGANGVLLDDIVVRGDLGEPIFSESFDNEQFRGIVQQRLFWSVIGGSLILVLVLRVLGFAAMAILSGIVATQISLVAAGFVISQFYMPTMLAQYPKIDQLMKEKEDEWSAGHQKKNFDDLKAQFSSKAPEGTLRIMVVGTSQTAMINGFVDQLEALLNNNTTSCNYELVKFGCAASWSKPLLRDYLILAPTIMPDVCIVNLSCNDEPEDRKGFFTENLTNFVEYNREHGIETIFVREAQCVDIFPVRQNHLTMQAVADKLGVPVVDAHFFLAKHMNEGLLWWDFVHPTNFGHSLIAKAIAETLQRDVLPKLCEKIKTTSTNSVQQ